MTRSDEAFAAHVREMFEASASAKREAGHVLAEPVARAARLVADALRGGGILYTFGNGGSAADAQHLAGELVGRYRDSRRPLPAVALSTDPSALTCIANDFDFAEVFSRQVSALATDRDAVLGISTSGRSANVVSALEAARAKGARTIALSGGDGGEVVRHADVAIVVPSSVTARIQECHLVVLHALTEIVEELVLAP